MQPQNHQKTCAFAGTQVFEGKLHPQGGDLFGPGKQASEEPFNRKPPIRFNTNRL